MMLNKSRVLIAPKKHHVNIIANGFNKLILIFPSSSIYSTLIETFTDNLSKLMRCLSMNYAIYFNKKYKKVEHLCQEDHV